MLNVNILQLVLIRLMAVFFVVMIVIVYCVITIDKKKLMGSILHRILNSF